MRRTRWTAWAWSSSGTAGRGRPPSCTGRPWRGTGEVGDRVGEAEATDHLGLVHRRQRRLPEAVDQHERALRIYRELGERGGEAEALNGLGEALTAAGRPGQARTRHVAALTIATEIGNRYEEGRAQHGLGSSHRADGDTGPARRHWQRALAVFAALGAPDAADVRARLDAFDPEPQPASTAEGWR